MLKLYGFKKVNKFARGSTRDLRILWALEEMQMPYELVGMDHPAQDLNSAAYKKMNPLQQIPVIDDDGNVLSESGAILIYLAKKSGKLIPKDLAGESQVIRWCFAALNSIEIPLMSILMLDWQGPKENRSYREFLAGWADRHLGNLELWLKDHSFVATGSFTVADILLTNVLQVVKDQSLLEKFENIRAYRDRNLARPAWKKTLEKYLEYVEPA